MTLKAEVDSRILDIYPDYRALLLKISGIEGAPSNDFSNNLLLQAEKIGNDLLSNHQIDEIQEIINWRDAYLKFGVKQRVARSSFESLLRRCEKGLPRIDLLTDIYNYLSIKYRTPIGGEDFSKYVGNPHLKIADGTEGFETFVDGEIKIDNPEVGEVIWCDDLGVTCRRWNWRQSVRTHLGVDTKDALFIFDGIGQNAEMRVLEASEELIAISKNLWVDIKIESTDIPN
jgi:DNA/RNA-binding domain of Phe-tRNA-synthetase-like protein